MPNIVRAIITNSPTYYIYHIIRVDAKGKRKGSMCGY
jgi:hypothetical protein